MSKLSKRFPKSWLTRGIMTVFAALAIMSFSGVVFASGGGGHDSHGPAATKVWDVNKSTGERDYTDTYRVMNFAVLMIGLFLILRKPVAEALNTRIEDIRDQLGELEAQKKDAEKKLSDYNEKISKLDSEASKIIDQYISQGKAAKDRIIKEAASAAQKMEDQARRNIDHEFKLAKKKLQEEIVAKALGKAEELITKSITSDDQERLVDEYINKVVA